ncbi:hypothetical protein LEP1GSC062_2570 [Leptospira alexanderi serovar Manhao 3 str. L 60]|uniref:Uncharacterized protein n=1 Tax=Leptospira alexanderi serovar Manhao 3 str. L 60 TaxID=1049759 RepID=V6I0B8_9LEPT|nr:hypothetical protein LEP1GSC062_2570 [Leptospira alexanderi serovar Manhao 3 str. L 60]
MKEKLPDLFDSEPVLKLQMRNSYGSVLTIKSVRKFIRTQSAGTPTFF